jgi:hypothetical protein
MKLVLTIATNNMTTEQLTNIKPDEKDKERAINLRFQGRTFYGNSAPFAGKTLAQLKMIKDPEKMVRRCKAFINEYGYQETVGYSSGKPVERDRISIGKTCEEFLSKIGFNREQIDIIRRSS